MNGRTAREPYSDFANLVRAKALNLVGVATLGFLIFGFFLTSGCSQPDDLNTLMQRLDDEDPQVRAKAAQALGDIGDPCAVEPLLAALEDRH